MPHNKYATTWIARATEDIKVMEQLIVDPYFAHSVCFHAQQAMVMAQHVGKFVQQKINTHL